VNDGAHDVDFAIVEVQVAPSQSEELALAQPSRDIEEDQQTGKGCDVVEKPLDLVDVQDFRDSATFGTLANELDRIFGVEFLSAGMVEQNAHDVPDLGEEPRAKGS
jgi:hypothetical protein